MTGTFTSGAEKGPEGQKKEQYNPNREVQKKE
jgi:hypothetical protein